MSHYDSRHVDEEDAGRPDFWWPRETEEPTHIDPRLLEASPPGHPHTGAGVRSPPPGRDERGFVNGPTASTDNLNVTSSSNGEQVSSNDNNNQNASSSVQELSALPSNRKRAASLPLEGHENHKRQRESIEPTGSVPRLTRALSPLAAIPPFRARPAVMTSTTTAHPTTQPGPDTFIAGQTGAIQSAVIPPATVQSAVPQPATAQGATAGAHQTINGTSGRTRRKQMKYVGMVRGKSLLYELNWWHNNPNPRTKHDIVREVITRTPGEAEWSKVMNNVVKHEGMAVKDWFKDDVGDADAGQAFLKQRSRNLKKFQHVGALTPWGTWTPGIGTVLAANGNGNGNANGDTSTNVVNNVAANTHNNAPTTNTNTFANGHINTYHSGEQQTQAPNGYAQDTFHPSNVQYDVQQPTEPPGEQVTGFSQYQSGQPTGNFSGPVPAYQDDQLSADLYGRLSTALYGQLNPDLYGQSNPDLYGQLSADHYGALNADHYGQFNPYDYGQFSQDHSGQSFATQSGQPSTAQNGQFSAAQCDPLLSQGLNQPLEEQNSQSSIQHYSQPSLAQGSQAFSNQLGPSTAEQDDELARNLYMQPSAEQDDELARNLYMQPSTEYDSTNQQEALSTEDVGDLNAIQHGNFSTDQNDQLAANVYDQPSTDQNDQLPADQDDQLRATQSQDVPAEEELNNSGGQVDDTLPSSFLNANVFGNMYYNDIGDDFSEFFQDHVGDH